MLRLPSFRLLQPASLAEAASMLAGEGPRARLVAGGTDLWPNMKRRHQKAEVVISLARVPELRGIRGPDEGSSGELRIGAAETLTDVERHPVQRGARRALPSSGEQTLEERPAEDVRQVAANGLLPARADEGLHPAIPSQDPILSIDDHQTIAERFDDAVAELPQAFQFGGGHAGLDQANTLAEHDGVVSRIKFIGVNEGRGEGKEEAE